jgi:hypothetical protein
LGKIGKVRRIKENTIFVKLKNFLLTQENKSGKLGKLEGYAAVQRALRLAADPWLHGIIIAL